MYRFPPRTLKQTKQMMITFLLIQHRMWLDSSNKYTWQVKSMANPSFSSSDSFEKLGVDSVLRENQFKRVGNNVLEPKIKCDQLFCLFRRMFDVSPFFEENPPGRTNCYKFAVPQVPLLFTVKRNLYNEEFFVHGS